MSIIEDPEIVREFITESNDYLEDIESKTLLLEKKPDDLELINGIFRPIHSMKGSAGFLRLYEIASLSHELETLLDNARRGKIKITLDIISLVLESMDMFKKLIGNLSKEVEKPGELKGDAAGISNEVEALKHKVSSVITGFSPEGRLTFDRSNEQRNPALRTPQSEPPTVRVPINKLDALVNLVGELVISQALISEEISSASENGISKDLTCLGKIIKEIQDQVMLLRMVPLKPTFQKMARLVRDLSATSGKKIQLEISGENTELDKTIIEQINDPLVHLIRNAIDHGIESTEERIARNKPETVTIRLNAFYKGGNIIIETSDDGRGLSRDKILKKAIEKGIIDEHAVLTDSQIYNLIFLPGFSTAERVTDISGRGFGMDVVKKNIEKLRGKIDIYTKEGFGTKFSIRLPLTLAIIDGMIVEVGSERFIIPVLSIEEFIRPEREEVFTVQNKGEIVNVRGELLPIVRLHEVYRIKPKEVEPWNAILVIVEGEGQRFCLFVDELIGQQQVVIKSLGDRLKPAKGITGGAILGDGKVVLILDVGSIMDIASN